MTLSSDIYVLDPVKVDDLFAFCQSLLGEYDDDRRGPDRQRSTNKQDSTWDGESWAVREDNSWSMANVIGQGLPAILDVAYRPDAPLRTPEMVAPHTYDGWCNHPDNPKHYDSGEPLCDKTEHDVPCWLNVDFDTTYGYRDERGWGCGDLHAVLISRVGQWLDERGIRWSWRNEFTGDIHGGEDRYERLIELTSGGFEASAWLRATVLPAIASQVRAEGGDPS